MRAETLFERQQAARAVGLTYDEFLALPGDPRYIDPATPSYSKAHVLAFYRTQRLLEAVQQDMQVQEAKRNRRR